MDLKVKTLDFVVSNNETANRTGDITKYDPSNDNPRTTPFAEMDNRVNAFIEGKKIEDIKVNDLTIHRGQDGKSDTVLRTYTILYY